MVSVLPTMSSRKTGLYFSTLHRSSDWRWSHRGGDRNVTHQGRSYVDAAVGFAVTPLRAPADDDSAFDIEKR